MDTRSWSELVLVFGSRGYGSWTSSGSVFVEFGVVDRDAGPPLIKWGRM